MAFVIVKKSKGKARPELRWELQRYTLQIKYIMPSPQNFWKLSREYSMKLWAVIDIILPIALWPWVRLSLWQKWVPGGFPGGKGGWRVGVRQPYRLSGNLGASSSWNPQGLSRPVMGLLYLYLFTLMWAVTMYWGNGKVHHITGHEGLEGEKRCSCTLSLTCAGLGGWLTRRCGRFTPGKDLVPIV